MHGAAAPGRRGGGGSSIETGNYLGTSRSVVRQSQRFRENESGNAMKSLLGADHLAWDTKNKQGVFEGQRAHSGDMAAASAAARPKQIVCPYRVGDTVMYRQANGELQQVTVAQVNTNVALGEDPYVAVRMDDGNVRDTVLERLSAVPALEPVPEPEPEPPRRRGRRRDTAPGSRDFGETHDRRGYAPKSHASGGGGDGRSHGSRGYGSRSPAASGSFRPYGRQETDGYSSPSWLPSASGSAPPRRQKDALHTGGGGFGGGGFGGGGGIGGGSGLGGGYSRFRADADRRRDASSYAYGAPAAERQVRSDEGRGRWFHGPCPSECIHAVMRAQQCACRCV
jgi:hypothetical protein